MLGSGMEELKLPAVCFNCRRRFRSGSMLSGWPQYLLWLVQGVLISIIVGAYLGL